MRVCIVGILLVVLVNELAWMIFNFIKEDFHAFIWEFGAMLVAVLFLINFKTWWRQK